MKSRDTAKVKADLRILYYGKVCYYSTLSA